MKKRIVTVVPPHNSLEKEEAKKARGLRADAFLWDLLAEARQRMDPATWIDSGGLEADSALRAWDTGGAHGFFGLYQERAAVNANRPSPSYTETMARRQVIRLCEALWRADFGRGAARRLAAKAFEKESVFVHISPGAIRHWQDREAPLGPEDEKAISMAMQRCGNDPKLLASHFVGLALAVHNPAARIL